jgi:SAM-dependent methyltransferase
MSDPLSVAEVLAKRFRYVNTTFHREPRFDIMAPPAHAQYDFAIASEVFEHVRPPIQNAFDNLFSLLKPGGFAVFSTPYELEGGTIEHFPSLHDWRLVELRSGYVLVNRTSDGRLETFEQLDFHGGPGSVLEMRIFSQEGLFENCRKAGFEINVAGNVPEWGIEWEGWSRGLLLRKPPL